MLSIWIETRVFNVIIPGENNDATLKNITALKRSTIYKKIGQSSDPYVRKYNVRYFLH